MSDSTLEYITRLADQLSDEEKLSLVEHLTKSLRQTHEETNETAPSPQSLRGIWKEHFPNDFDVDEALKEIRHEWEKEWPEVFKR